MWPSFESEIVPLAGLIVNYWPNHEPAGWVIWKCKLVFLQVA